MESEKQRYLDLARLRHQEAITELVRLQEVLKDACWYNFEVRAQWWKPPWRESAPSSRVLMHGLRCRNRYYRKKRHECVDFPVWYEGAVKDAPSLPIEILATDVKMASKYADKMLEQLYDAEDWAPDGWQYERLRQETLVGKTIFSPEDV